MLVLFIIKALGTLFINFMAFTWYKTENNNLKVSNIVLVIYNNYFYSQISKLNYKNKIIFNAIWHNTNLI